MSVLEVKGLTRFFGDFRAVHDVSFKVEEGEKVAIIGPNGAGKSTLFNLLSGSLRPTAGEITLFGTPVGAQGPHKVSRLGVGRSFQVSSVFSELTVRENVQVALMARDGGARTVWRRAWRSRIEEADAVLADVGLLELIETPAGTLSHGDQRRLELALSISQRPRLLMLDEPTAGMAPEETLSAVELVRRLADAFELTLLFTEHDMEVVFNTADRVIVMYQGGVIADGTPEVVRDLAQVREVYLGVDA